MQFVSLSPESFEQRESGRLRDARRGPSMWRPEDGGEVRAEVRAEVIEFMGVMVAIDPEPAGV